MAWACMAAKGTGSLMFIDEVTADTSSKMNSEVYGAILSAHIQLNVYVTFFLVSKLGRVLPSVDGE